MNQTNDIKLDALLPAEMACKAEQVGVKKAHMDPITVIVLAILAGAFIGLGAIFSTTAIAGTADKLPYGVVRLLAGFTFTLGLILVIVAGAELFTGNNLLSIAWMGRQIGTGLLLRNWVLVYAGNLLGSIATAALSFLSGQYASGAGSVGMTALTIANTKVHLGFIQAIALGILCNALVCLAVWLTYSARTTTDRILAIIPPIAAFVAAGYEHSIANMYFIPVALLVKSYAPATFWTTIGKVATDFPDLTWGNFFIKNLLPVTIGNIIGGAIMVGVVYWFIYLRKRSA